MGLSSILGAVGGAFANPMVAAGALGGMSSIASYIGQKKTNEMSRDSARENMAFQERMSSSAYQRGMEDMRKAGLNPILAGKLGGASTPGGAMPQFNSALGAGVQGLNQGITTATNAMQTTAQTRLTDAQAVLAENLENVSESGNKLAGGLKDILSHIDESLRDGGTVGEAKEAAELWIDAYRQKAINTGKNASRAFEKELEKMKRKFKEMFRKVDNVDPTEPTNWKVNPQ